MSESHVDGSGVLINMTDAAHSTGHAHGVDIYATRKSHRHSQSRVGDKLFTKVCYFLTMNESNSLTLLLSLMVLNSYGSRTCKGVMYKT